MTTKVVHRGDTRVEAAMDLRQLSNCRRIALLLGGTFDPSGGMYEYGKAWHRQLSDTGWMVTLFASKSIAEDSDAEDAEVVIETGSQKYSYSQLALGSFWRSSYWKRFITRIIDGVRKNNIGIVHIVDRPVYAASIAAALRNAFPELLIVSTIHDPAWHQEHISLLGALLKYWDDQRLIWLSKHRTLWLHVHNRLLTKGTGFDGSERIVEMPHPRPLPQAKRTRRTLHDRYSESQENAYPIVFGFVGRIEPYKGLNILLKALVQLVAVRPDYLSRFSLIIAGRSRSRIEVPDSLRQRVQVRDDFLCDKDFHQLVANLDFLVLPYVSGTASGVGMLGLTYGLPIVASDVGLLPSLVTQDITGLIFRSGDAGDLQAQLEKILVNLKLADRLSTGARAVRYTARAM